MTETLNIYGFENLSKNEFTHGLRLHNMIMKQNRCFNDSLQDLRRCN